MDVNSLVQTVAIYALPVLFAITLHEAAHGYVARHFGDMTAHAQGRISLNPLRHIDLIGTDHRAAGADRALRRQFAFGWAKPVPVNSRPAPAQAAHGVGRGGRPGGQPGDGARLGAAAEDR